MLSGGSTTAVQHKLSRSTTSRSLQRDVICRSGSGRRQILAAWLAAPVILAAGDIPAAEEAEGNCPTCLGPIGGTLGVCSGDYACSSSYDDRPPYFVAPWQFEGSQAAAMRSLVDVLQELGAAVQQQTADYLYATLSSGTAGGLIDMEFLFAENDNTVALRAALQQDQSSSSSSMVSRGAPRAFQTAVLSLLGSKPSQVLDSIRLRLGWEEVPILRNRQRVFLFGESPFDGFGPVPPPVPDYSRDLSDF